jgi:hypothetical protein
VSFFDPAPGRRTGKEKLKPFGFARFSGGLPSHLLRPPAAT